MYCLVCEPFFPPNRKTKSTMSEKGVRSGLNSIWMLSVWSPMDPYVGQQSRPPEYPTTVRRPSYSWFSSASGPQNQPTATVATSRRS